MNAGRELKRTLAAKRHNERQIPTSSETKGRHTSFGCDNMMTWLDSKTVVVAFIYLAMVFSCSVSTHLSLLATMYHAGQRRDDYRPVDSCNSPIRFR
jgi:hypothetical protein